MEQLWSISTTIREAERITGFLKTASEIDGEKWDSDTQAKFQILLVKNRQYLNDPDNSQIYGRLNEEQCELLRNKALSMTYGQAEGIINAKNYEGGPAMRGRQSMSPLYKLGLVYIVEGRVHVTDTGHKLINEEISFGDFMLDALLKFQYPNPYESSYQTWNTKPFMNICGLFERTQKDPLECAYTIDVLKMENFFIIPSDIDLAEQEMKLITLPAREKKLKRALEKLSPYFDYCFIDCPPQLSILMFNGINAADEVIIPCKTDFLAYKGMKALLSTIKNVQSDPDMNPNLKIAGIIATIYEQRVKDQRDVWDLLHELNIPFLGTVKKSADAPRAVYQGLPAVIAQGKSEVAQAYFEIASKIFI